jgi:5-methylcytosine-specific restriction endonuclease McrA
MAKPDYRSPEAAAYRKLYKGAAWQRARAYQLSIEPLCMRCKTRGIIVPATVVNHITPHKGDLTLFYDPANHESTCKPCHDGAIQSEERIGFSKEIGIDGWPTDQRHPANR